MDSLLGVEGRPNVSETDTGNVAVWVGDQDAPIGLVFSRPAAVLVARELLAIADEQDAVADAAAVVHAVQIRPPVGREIPGRIRIDLGGRTIDLLIDWLDLVGLADTARAAVQAADPEGSA